MRFHSHGEATQVGSWCPPDAGTALLPTSQGAWQSLQRIAAEKLNLECQLLVRDEEFALEKVNKRMGGPEGELEASRGALR
eukprot:4516070-Amphidinium_carterae.1